MANKKIIYIYAAVFTDEQSRILIVKKTEYGLFNVAGGKIAVGERPTMALMRELHDEL